MNPKHSELLANQTFATSPGMTDETKVFTLTFADGTASFDNIVQADGENRILVGKILVPLETFQDTGKFRQWTEQMHQKGFMVGMDVLAARSLLPEDAGKRFEAQA